MLALLGKPLADERGRNLLVVGAVSTWRRVHIIGGAGSGKTTLARQFAEQLAGQAYDLDAIAYEDGAGPKRSLDLRRVDVHRIAVQSAWASEGGFLWWVDELLQAADAIVWLDLPWHIAARRALIRHMRASLAGTNKHRGLRKLLRFVRWTRRYYTSAPVPTAPDDDAAMSRAATQEALRPHMHKVVHCRRPSEVKAVLKALG